jgi:hypothetical protein
MFHTPHRVGSNARADSEMTDEIKGVIQNLEESFAKLGAATRQAQIQIGIAAGQIAATIRGLSAETGTSATGSCANVATNVDAASEVSAARNTRAEQLTGSDNFFEPTVDALSQIQKSWQHALQPIIEKFASVATDVVTRGKSIAAACDEMVRSIVDDLLDASFKSLFESLLGFAANGVGLAAGEGAGDFGLVGSATGGLVKDALGAAVGDPFIAVSGGLLGGSLAGLFGAGGVSVMAADVASMWGGGGEAAVQAGLSGGGGILSGLGNGLMGLLSFLGRSIGGTVPSAAGGWVVPHFGDGGILSVLHQNEMVLPAHISEGFQDLLGRGAAPGGHTFNLNINAWDARSVMNAGPQIVAAINRAIRNGSMLHQPS